MARVSYAVVACSLLVAALMCNQAAALARTFTITNYCNTTLWWSLTPGAVVNPKTKTAHCNNQGDCAPGSTCSIPPNLCFWSIPRPSSGNFRLNPQVSVNVDLPVVDNGIDVIWSGNLGACAAGTCESSDQICDQKGCRTGAGSPQTQAEFTLVKNNVDFYDVEVINGHNIATEMSPVGAQVKADDVYWCGNPGGRAPLQRALAPCTWHFNPPNLEYNWVSTGGRACRSQGDCSGSDICGLSNNVGVAQRLQRVCGRRLGYWTADQICGIDPNFGAPVNCATHQPAPLQQLTNWQLYQCQPPMTSCYQPQSADNNCCGCANWWEEGLPVPSATRPCLHKNNYWRSVAMPTLKFLKQACPTAYTYPYDDPSSTFTCSVNREEDGGINSVNYRINFCNA